MNQDTTHIAEMRIRISAQAPRYKWRNLADAIGAHWMNKPDEDSLQWHAKFSALEEDDNAKHYYHCSFESNSQDGSSANFTLMKLLKPSDEVPKAIVVSSGQVGGFRTVMHKLAQAWPSDGREVGALVMRVVSKSEAINAAFCPLDTKIGGLSFTPKFQAWTVGESDSKLREVAWIDNGADFFLASELEDLSVEFSERIFHELDDLSWGIVKPLLEAA